MFVQGQIGIDLAAARDTLAGGVVTIGDQYLTAIPGALVTQLTPELGQAQRPWLNLGDSDVPCSCLAVRRPSSRYDRLVADAPELALRHNTRSRLLQLVAPSSLKASEKESFYVFSLPDMDAAITLAAMLERDTRWPLQTGWGRYLLEAGFVESFSKPLMRAGVGASGSLIAAGRLVFYGRTGLFHLGMDSDTHLLN